MATTSTGNGNWHTAGTWDNGVPDAADVVTVLHNVTLAASQANVCLALDIGDSGTLTISAGATLTFTDNSGAYLKIQDGATAVVSNATAASPASFTSAGSPPTNYWYVLVEDQTTIPDTRSLDFDYVKFSYNSWYLGNDTYYIRTNNGTTASGTITNVSPLIREPQLQIHFAEGRTKSRVYHMGSHAGVVTVTGKIPWSSWAFQSISDLIASKQRVSFFSMYTHVPICRIERASFRPAEGSYVEFTITLVEDV